MENTINLDKESKTIKLVMLALKKMSDNRDKTSKIYSNKNIKFFIESLISKNDIKLIEYTEKLFKNEKQYEIFFEKFIPEVAEDLGNSWKDDELSFAEVSLAASRLQRLVKVFEKQYLGPIFSETNGPEILLILPNTETHSLAPIIASGILKKAGSNPFLAIGYTNDELVELVKKRNFRIIGFSVSDSKNISECIKISNLIKKVTNTKVPFVLGGQGTKDINLNLEKENFSLVTSNPQELLSLLN